MKLILRFFAVWLVPLLSISGLALSRQDAFYGTDEFGRDVYSGEPVYPADYPFYRAPSRNFDPSYNEYMPRGQRAWTYDSDGYQRGSYAVPNPELERSPGWGYASHSHVDQGNGSYWGSRNRQEMRGSWGDASPNAGTSRNGYAPAPVRGYGFRGDVPPELGDWRGPLRRPEYRFRPLSEQERARLYTGAEWRRLRAPGPAREQPGYIDPVPSEEAYGYQPDSWLRSYDGGGR